ncbi:hypothetical protein TKK_0000516 [Trichogramma kaykai]
MTFLTTSTTVVQSNNGQPQQQYHHQAQYQQQQQAKDITTLDALLSATYCRSQKYLSRQLAQLHPELTMPMFSEVTYRFQTARREVRQLLLQYLLPWLHNMELVDPNVPPCSNPLSYFQAKRVVLYLARARPDRLVDEMMSELQTVETLNCLIERTETPPFYRLTSMRKASSHSDAPAADPGNPTKDLTVEKGTIHTKRHSGEDPIKSGSQPLWNYEDMTAKVWWVRSAEQLTTLLRHVLRVFRDSLPHALVSQRWAQTALQLGLSCSSRHYAGRSLQVFRALKVPITSRMLSDILSRLVETVAEQGEDMQGYVTELLLTLEAAVDSLESDFRPLDFMKEIFKSTPNLNNKDAALAKRSSAGPMGYPNQGPQMYTQLNQPGHMRSTSYSVSYSSRKSAAAATAAVEAKEMEKSGCVMTTNTSLSRSRSAQSLKLLGDSATQDDKMTILAQLFWLSVSLLESDYEHEFLLALRLLDRVLHRLPLDRPDARDKVEKLQQQLKWNTFPGVHALLLKGPHWREALKILKLVVTRSSTLSAPPTTVHATHWELSISSPHPSFNDNELFSKKELPDIFVITRNDDDANETFARLTDSVLRVMSAVTSLEHYSKSLKIQNEQNNLAKVDC